MKRLQRVTAFILTLILAVQGLPADSIAQAAFSAESEMGGYADASEGPEGGADASGDLVLTEEQTLAEKERAERGKKMRFVQTGFDEGSGILTMSLQIKMEPGDPQQTVSEGVFVFQTDATTVVPVTRPAQDVQSGQTEERKSFFLPEGMTGIVTDNSSSTSKYIKDYLESGEAERISENSFSLAMSNSRFLPAHTGYMVSSARAVHSGKSTGLLDCYFQFMYNPSEFPGMQMVDGKYESVWNWSEEKNGYVSNWIWDSKKKQYVASAELNTDPGTDPNIAVEGEDLYINVMDFDFQCYFGFENGEPKPALNTDSLFSNSIKVPQNSTEVEEILKQFTYRDKDTNEEIAMAMGGAGFIPKYWDESTAQMNDMNTTAYYYFDEPVLSKWRKNGSTTRPGWSKGPAEKIEGETTPGLWYPNWNNKFIILGLRASFENTISSLADPIADADFRIPLDSTGKREVETGNYPRYAIPTAADPQNMVPKAYQMKNTDNSDKRSRLKYFLGTEVTENSESSPEKEDLAAFLGNMRWGFVLPDSTPLENITSLSGGGRKVTVALDKDEDGKEITERITGMSGQEYLVKYATITDVTEGAGGQAAETEGGWNGAKLWEVYKVQAAAEGGETETPQETYEYYMRSPVGVILDMDPTTEVHWYDADTGTVDAAGMAPQLSVTKYAADPASYIWKCSPKPTEMAEVMFQPVYETGGLKLSDIPMKVRLYKDASVATSADLQTEKITQVAGPTATPEEKPLPVDGFWVGKAAANGELTLNSEGRVTKDSNEEAEDTRQDAVSSGIAVKSFLYDQYGIAFQDKKNELRLWTEADIRAAEEAKRKGEAFVDHSPFEVVPVNGKTGWYTIKYKSGKGINDVEEGEYILQAIYDVIREPYVEVDPPKTLYVKKPKSRLSYMATTFVGDGAVGTSQKVVENGVEGEIIEVVCDVPERTGKTAASKTPTIRIDELANQWREPGDFLETQQIQNYDIVSGIREAEGSPGINIIKARTKGIQIGIERIYEGSEDNGPAPRGITFGVYKKVGGENQFVPLSESGQFTYTSDVLHDTQFSCRITATYEGESRFVEYRFRFVRDLDNLKLSGIVVTPPTDPNSDHIRVPLPSEKDNTVQIQLVMKDQYNSDLDQDDVLEAYRPGGSMNNTPGENNWPDYPEWGVYLYPSSTLPAGVHLDHDKNTITVDSTAADESTFQIYAKLGTTESDPVTVRVSRDGSKPNTVSDITYSRKSGSNMELVTELESPGKNSAAENEYFPSVTVTNQYNRVLEPQRELPEQRGYYKAAWTISKVTPASAREYLDIDSFTGKLTVRRCAPNCTVTVRLRADTRYGSNSNTITLEVKRKAAVPETLALEETEVPYPTTDEKLDDPQSAYVPLTVKGTTQYGDDQVFKHGEGDGSVTLTWTLDQVEFNGPGPNGEKDSNGHYTLYRQRLNDSTGKMENTGDITDSSGSWTAWNSVEMSKSGVLHFLDITQKEKLPWAVWVTVTYGTGTDTVTTGKHKIEINWDTKNVPQQIQIAETYKYSSGVEIPRADVPTELPLQGEVRNQYGVVIDTPVEWTAAEEVKGMTLLKKADGSYAVKIDYTAVKGSTLRLTAKCKEAPNVTVDLPITVIGSNEPLEVDSVVMTGMRDPSGKTLALTTNGDGVPEITIPLPAKTGKGYDTYKIVCNVLSQFRQPMSGEVDWTIDAPEGVTAAFLDDSEETVKDIRISFTEEARNALLGDPATGDVKFTIHASCQGKPDPSDTEKQKESTCVVRFKLADPQVAYATPQVTDYGVDPFRETVGGIEIIKPRVPEWGKEATKVTLKATVYDQYGVEMPGEAAEMQLLTLDPSLALTGNVLSISSSFIGNLATVQATPKGMPQAVWTESQKLIEMYADPAYPFGLKIGENSVFDTDIHYEHVDIPLWESYTVYVKDEDTAITMPLEAKVVNQREGVFDWDSSLYPIWEFASDHEGVEFDNPELDDAGNVKGSAITLKITNQAAQSIPDGQLERVVTLKVSTNGKSGGNFEKLVKVHLTRNRRRPTYMYIEGSDESGEDKTGLERPYAEDKTTEYQFKPVVYDQYGQPLELPVNMDLDLEALNDIHDTRVEKIYKRGESEEKGDEPIAYEIYWVEQEATETEKAKETLIAEFSRETGMVKLYTVCSSELLPSLKLNAKYGDLPLKSLRVYNVQEESIPYTVKVNRSHGDFVISGKGEPISDYITPAVYDQYGQALPFNRLLNIQWALYMPEKDETGAYVPYADYDKDGHEKLKADWLILHKETAAQTYSTVLTVQPDQFIENQSAILQCVVSYIQYVDGVRKVKTLSKDTPIRVNRPASGGGGIIVTFDAGEYGKLVGEGQMELNLGETPNAPGVKTVIGYGFMGWTTDGETIVDASKLPLFEDTAYVAVYKDITNTKFLEGYKNGTVRPEAAVTRAEFVTMLARALGGYDGSKNYGASYPDVAKGKWYANYIAYAKQKGLTSGYPDGTFRPNAPITRAEAARLLTVAAELPAGKAGSFSDVKEGAWYTGAIESLAAAGIASGYPDGTYRPDKHITRAEAVRLIVMMTENALDDLQRKNIQENAYCPFSDIKKGHWAYAYILRAAGVA